MEILDNGRCFLFNCVQDNDDELGEWIGFVLYSVFYSDLLGRKRTYDFDNHRESLLDDGLIVHQRFTENDEMVYITVDENIKTSTWENYINNVNISNWNLRLKWDPENIVYQQGEYSIMVIDVVRMLYADYIRTHKITPELAEKIHSLPFRLWTYKEIYFVNFGEEQNSILKWTHIFDDYRNIVPIYIIVMKQEYKGNMLCQIASSSAYINLEQAKENIKL